MMSVKANFGYTEYQGFRMVEIPYEGGGFAMYVVLSPDGMDIDSAIPYIGESMYDAAMSSLVPREIALTMPKYRLASSMVLNKTLQKMGLKTAFTPAADFKGISLSGPLQVDLVKQKCYIDVSEKGTEAAAVTSGQIRLTSVRPVTEFKVDKPFLFMIADREDKDILFAGKIVDIR
jgi:serpin B